MPCIRGLQFLDRLLECLTASWRPTYVVKTSHGGDVKRTYTAQILHIYASQNFKHLCCKLFANYHNLTLQLKLRLCTANKGN
jgi:hypothetical protein